MVQQVKDSDEFSQILSAAGTGLVIADFFATWCGSCKMIAPKFETFSKEYDDIKFLKVDVDECEDLARKYEIEVMPTFIFIRNNEKVDSFSGSNSDRLKETIERHKAGSGPVAAIEEVDMNSAIAKTVKEVIQQNKVVIFSKTFCPYCNMAKKVFEEIGQEVKAVELNTSPDGDAIQDVLEVLTKARSVPRVFVNGKFIGGGTETQQLKDEGKLQELLAQSA